MQTTDQQAGDAILLSPAQTANYLPFLPLAQEIEALLRDPGVRVPARQVMGWPGGGSLFVMPAHDDRLGMSKVITFTPANAGSPRPTIQGDVLVFDIRTGARLRVLDGPTVTACRTAAVSLLAAQRLAPRTDGPLLIVGAGVQGRAHLDAFVQGLGVQEVWVASRSARSTQALLDHARRLGLTAHGTDDPQQALRHCPLVVTGTPAQHVVLDGPLSADHFVAAVGAFTPAMRELGPALCQHVFEHGTVVVDTPDAQHEAGDLLLAGVPMADLLTLAQCVQAAPPRRGPVLFKSCGWAGWDLAAARLACPASATGSR